MLTSRSIVLILIYAFAQNALSLPVRAEPSEIERLLTPIQTQVDGHLVYTKDLRSVYALRGFQPIWTTESGNAVLASVKQVAEKHGLPPQGYSVTEELTGAAQDIAISASALRLGRDLSTGRIAPYRLIGGPGEALRPRFDGPTFLKALVQTENITLVLERLAPQTPEYTGLVAGLKTYRTFAAEGGWPNVPEGGSVKPDESSDRIPALRKRLIISGELGTEHEDGTILDANVVSALKLFQLRHGLDPDGAVGKKTVAALNMPVQARIQQIELSLERLRQLPRQREANRIDVNIASQTLILTESKSPTLEMRVVTGDVKHQTPTMTTRVAAITLNPTWTVPASIARKEILPKLKRDPNYLAHNNLHILDNTAHEGTEPDGAGIDWTKMGSSFPFVLRQVPGPDNALGQIKFNLQNQDSIYMHDTPQKTFFKRSYRLLSHGCIRLEHPQDLADHLLGEEWRDKLPPMIAEGKTKTLILKRALPVYLMYQTAWADADGSIEFRDDSYGNDSRLSQALSQSAAFWAKENPTDHP